MKVYGRERTPREPPETIKVGMADYAVSDAGVTLSTSGLGSCVGVALYDAETGVSGLAHVMLPSSEGRSIVDEGKFADTAIAAMLAEMERLGADPESVEAKLAGGSNVLEFESIDGAIGTRNVEAVEAVLDDHDVAIVAADVGGKHGRSLRFDAETATLLVRSAGSGVREL